MHEVHFIFFLFFSASYASHAHYFLMPPSRDIGVIKMPAFDLFIGCCSYCTGHVYIPFGTPNAGCISLSSEEGCGQGCPPPQSVKLVQLNYFSCGYNHLFNAQCSSRFNRFLAMSTKMGLCVGKAWHCLWYGCE